MFDVSIREHFSVLNVFIVCIRNTAVFKLIPLMCTHVYSYMFSTVHPPRIWAKTQLVYLHSEATGIRHALRRQVTSTQIAGSSTHGSCTANATPGIFVSVDVDSWMQQVKSCKQEESVHKYQDEDLHQPFGRRGCPASCHSRLKDMVTPPWPLVNLWLPQPLPRHRHPPHLIH